MPTYGEEERIYNERKSENDHATTKGTETKPLQNLGTTKKTPPQKEEKLLP